MSGASLPEGYRWTWRGDTVRLHLPPMVFEDGRCYEPVLSRRDAERIAEAVGERTLGGSGRGGVSSPTAAPAKVLLARDPRYSASTVDEFRSWLSVALVENGIEFPITETNATAAIQFEPPSGDAALPPPPAAPASPTSSPTSPPPLPKPPDRERSGFRPPTWRRKFHKGG